MNSNTINMYLNVIPYQLSKTIIKCHESITLINLKYVWFYNVSNTAKAAIIIYPIVWCIHCAKTYKISITFIQCLIRLDSRISNYVYVKWWLSISKLVYLVFHLYMGDYHYGGNECNINFLDLYFQKI